MHAGHGLNFRKSSHSDGAHNCVEVAEVLFRKSSYSAGTDNCVEVAEVPFHKSSYSNGSGGECVEVAEGNTGAALRDSKHPDLGHLSFASREWGALLNTLGTA